MAKDPAFLFYPNDWVGGTMGMTFEEKGAYMELLMMQFNRGHMTTHMIGHTVGQLWVKISAKFIQDPDGLWYNERLEVEKKKRQTFTESRRNNVKGDNQYTPKNRSHDLTSDLGVTAHMENVNEDIDLEKNTIVLSNIDTGKKKSFDKKEGEVVAENSELHPMQIFIRDQLPFVSKIKNQLTFEQAKKLREEFDSEKLLKILHAMENKKGVEKEYTSVNLTIRNWISRNYETKEAPKNNRPSGF